MLTHQCSNPHPVRKLGAIRSDRPLQTRAADVPILTQSENWALCAELLGIAAQKVFQSSPSPKTGRYLVIAAQNRKRIWFQSSPSPKTGRYCVIHSRLLNKSMFQSSPSPKTGRYLSGARLFILQVPILTQSENWALFKGAISFVLSKCSNPHPVRKLGAILVALTALIALWGSNPHPVRKLGAIPDSQSLDRVWSSSNPHPVRKLGAMQAINKSKIASCSNPHPVRKLGAIHQDRAARVLAKCSNPHPVRKLGAIARCRAKQSTRRVPILTQSENWAL